MQRNLLHRGPDGEGFFHQGPYTAAMRRLAIIDPHGSQQPLKSADGNLIMFFNGEIYNYRELRARLAHDGADFSTDGDGEVILHLYNRYGDRFVDHLRGMFAIALWDCESQELFLARDRFGEKPLYYFRDEDQLLFASEMKSIISSQQIDLAIDPVALKQFFYMNFVAEPRTMIEGVHKVSPASIMTFKAKTRESTSRIYWRPGQAPMLEQPVIETLRNRLHEAVQFSMRSDRPVGVALSGGLDSGAIAAIASRYRKDDLHAFSVGYSASEREASASDEREFARDLAESLGISFHDIEVTREDLVTDFERHIGDLDDPIADIASYNYACVAKKASQTGVPVLLFGHGGDELFLGYPWLGAAYRSLSRRQRWREGRVAPAGYSVDGCCAEGRSRYLNDWKEWQQSPRDSPFFHHSLDFQRAAEKFDGMLNPSFRRRLRESDQRDHPEHMGCRSNPDDHPAIRTSEIISNTYLASNGIPEADRLGMAHSVEARQPLLDVRLVETVMGAYKADAVYPPPSKARWRKVLETELPATTLERKKKPFRPPAAEWFQVLARVFGHRIKTGCLRNQGVFTVKTLAMLSEGKPEARIAMPFFFKAIVVTLWFDAMEKMIKTGKTDADWGSTPNGS